jgi:ketosteroid isomerase-like protein
LTKGVPSAPATQTVTGDSENPAAGRWATNHSKYREEAMKIRLAVALAGLAISFALPIFAQQKESTPNEQDRQWLDALVKKFDEAWNNNDAAALAAFYAEDAVIVTDTGPIYGRDAIEKHFADLFKQVHFSNHISKADQYSPHMIGTTDKAWSNGEWSTTVQGQNFGPVEIKGYWSDVNVREGNNWKDQLETFNITPAPAATPSPTASPSNQ